jgi:hypothetical protein
VIAELPQRPHSLRDTRRSKPAIRPTQESHTRADWSRCRFGTRTRSRAIRNNDGVIPRRGRRGAVPPRQVAATPSTSSVRANVRRVLRLIPIIEQVIADLQDFALTHPPSGVFTANAAWLAWAAIAHNLTHAAGALASAGHARPCAAPSAPSSSASPPDRPFRRLCTGARLGGKDQGSTFSSLSAAQRFNLAALRGACGARRSRSFSGDDDFFTVV